MTRAGRLRTLRTPRFAPGYCDRAVELGRAGKSRAEIAAELGCSRALMAKWEAGKADFAEALARARDLELAWWEGLGREGIREGKLNATLWSKAMSGRFADEGYGDRTPAPGKAPEAAARPRSHRDRAKAILMLLAQSNQSDQSAQSAKAPGDSSTDTADADPSASQTSATNRKGERP